MAVEQAKSAAQRRLVFGLNALLQAVLAIAVVIGIIWLAGRVDVQADWTRTGVNSLSPRTEQLLDRLAQNVRITAVFAEPDAERDPVGAKRYREIRDLLHLYDRAGGARVTTYVIDPSLEESRTQELLERLRNLPAYKDESEPHERALEEFPALSQDISELAGQAFTQLDETVQGNPDLAQNRNFSIVRNNLRRIVRDTEDVAQAIEELKKAEIPRYGSAVTEMRNYLEDAQLLLRDATAWMAGEGLRMPGITPELTMLFEQIPARAEPVLERIDAMLDRTKDLRDVELEQVYRDLSRWHSGPVVLVESEQEAAVVPFREIWEPPRDPNAPVGPDGDNRVFVGEAAISSEILHLTQEEKTGVVFTYYGDESPITPDFSQMNPMTRQMPQAPYQELAQRLEDANFVTSEWNVKEQKEPPAVEDAVRTVYLVFPPEPPPRQNPMQPAPQGGISPQEKQIIQDAVANAGMAIFLAGWTPPEMPVPGAKGAYEFAEYLRTTWGIEVGADYLAWQFSPNPQRAGWWFPARQEPLLTTDVGVKFTDHPIGAPSQGDRAGFYMTCPIEAAEDVPEGVTVEAVARVTGTEDIWALDDPLALSEQLKQNQGVKPQPADRMPPFPIAVAASKGENERIVVFGSKEFAADAIASASGIQAVGAQIVIGPLYPANFDVILNSLHWLTGEADRIAVGPREGKLPRLTELTDDWAAALPWLMVGVWPAVALIVGMGVWLVRRR